MSTVPIKIEDLKDFPEASWDSFLAANEAGRFRIGMDISAGFSWVQSGLYTPPWLRYFSGLALISNKIVFLVYFGVVVYHQLWWFLLALPVLVLSEFLLHPTALRFGFPLSFLLLWLSFAGVAWGLFFQGSFGVLLLSSCVLYVWLSLKLAYSVPWLVLMPILVEHEDLFCRMWCARLVFLGDQSGQTYHSTYQLAEVE